MKARGSATWFMDYRNADGSLREMCGNGIRVFARYLVDAAAGRPARPAPDRDPRRRQDAHLRRRPDHRRHGHARGPRRDHGAGGGAVSWPAAPRRHGQPARGRVRRRPRRGRPAARGAGARRGGLPRRRQRRVRRTPRRAARRDAGPRARLGGDPVVRHGCLRRAGGRRRSPTGPSAARRTPSTCPAAPSRSSGPPTTGSCSPARPCTVGTVGRTDLSERPCYRFVSAIVSDYRRGLTATS